MSPLKGIERATGEEVKEVRWKRPSSVPRKQRERRVDHYEERVKKVIDAMDDPEGTGVAKVVYEAYDKHSIYIPSDVEAIRDAIRLREHLRRRDRLVNMKRVPGEGGNTLVFVRSSQG